MCVIAAIQVGNSIKSPHYKSGSKCACHCQDDAGKAYMAQMLSGQRPGNQREHDGKIVSVDHAPFSILLAKIDSSER